MFKKNIKSFLSFFFKVISQVWIKLAPCNSLCGSLDKISLAESKKMYINALFQKISWTIEIAIENLEAFPDNLI